MNVIISGLSLTSNQFQIKSESERFFFQNASLLFYIQHIIYIEMDSKNFFAR